MVLLNLFYQFKKKKILFCLKKWVLQFYEEKCLTILFLKMVLQIYSKKNGFPIYFKNGFIDLF